MSAAAAIAEGHVGCLGRVVGKRLDVVVLQGLAREHGDADRHGGQRFVTLARRDRNGFQGVRFGRSRGGVRRRRVGGVHGNAANRKQPEQWRNRISDRHRVFPMIHSVPSAR
jgi:hypothetical protein